MEDVVFWILAAGFLFFGSPRYAYNRALRVLHAPCCTQLGGASGLYSRYAVTVCHVCCFSVTCCYSHEDFGDHAGAARLATVAVVRAASCC